MCRKIQRSGFQLDERPSGPSGAQALPEAGRAATHDLALTHELGVELRAVQGEVDVEVDAVEGALGSVHALEVLFEVLSAEV